MREEAYPARYLAKFTVKRAAVNKLSIRPARSRSVETRGRRSGASPAMSEIVTSGLDIGTCASFLLRSRARLTLELHPAGMNSRLRAEFSLSSPT